MAVDLHFACTFEDRTAWNQFVLQCPCTSFFATTHWFDSYTSFGMQTKYLLATDSGGKVIGGAAIGVFKIGPIKWLQVPHGPAVSELDGAQAVLDAIEDYGHQIGAAFVQVEPFGAAEYDMRWEEKARFASLPYDPDLPANTRNGIFHLLLQRGYTPGTYTDLLRAPRSGQLVCLGNTDPLDGFESKTRQKIRSTIRRRTEIHVQKANCTRDLETSYGLLADNSVRAGYPVRPWTSFVGALAPALEEEMAYVLTAFCSAEPVSTLVVMFGGSRSTCVMAGTHRVQRIHGIYPSYYLQYLAMKETATRGLNEYDLSATYVTEGVNQFKRSFGTKYYQLIEPCSKVLRPTYFRGYILLLPWMRKYRRRIANIIYRIHALRNVDKSQNADSS